MLYLTKISSRITIVECVVDSAALARFDDRDQLRSGGRLAVPTRKLQIKTVASSRIAFARHQFCAPLSIAISITEQLIAMYAKGGH